MGDCVRILSYVNDRQQAISWGRAAEDTLRIFDDAIGARKLKLGQVR